MSRKSLVLETTHLSGDCNVIVERIAFAGENTLSWSHKQWQSCSCKSVQKRMKDSQKAASRNVASSLQRFQLLVKTIVSDRRPEKAFQSLGLTVKDEDGWLTALRSRPSLTMKRRADAASSRKFAKADLWTFQELQYSYHYVNLPSEPLNISVTF